MVNNYRRTQPNGGLRPVCFPPVMFLPSPTSPILRLAGLLLAFWLVAGCAAVSGRRSASTAGSGRGDGTNPPPAATTADYSAAAVKARTESQALYAAAVLHEQEEEFELAIDAYLRAAAADPANEVLVLEAASRVLRYRAAEKGQDEAVASTRNRLIDILRKATAVPGATGLLYSRLGLLYSMVGKKELAIEANRKAIQMMPGSLSGYQYLAQIYLQAGQRDEGLKVLDEAARQKNVDSSFLIDLGETYIVFGRGGSMDAIRAKALAVFKRAASPPPTNPVQLQRLAEGFTALGETDSAIGIYRRVLERLPNLTVVREKLVELYLRKQDRTNAVTELRAIIRESPGNAQPHYLLGSILFEDRQLKEAAEAFRHTLILSPSFEPAYYDLAAAQMNSERVPEALETLQKARDKFQPSFVGEFYTGLAYGRTKDYTNSLKHLTSAEVIARATATNRLNHSFYFQLGAACERTQRFKEAETHFRKALAIQPDFAETLNYLGYMWAERGENLAEAREMIEKALKLEPKNAAFLDSMGWVLFKLGQPREALPHLIKAIELNDEPDATLYDHLGDVYAALKQPAKAREAWEKSVGIEANPVVSEKLKSASTPAAKTRP